jgi:hypothetical protein
MLQEFKKFALRGNVLDLAIGVIIGGAFGKIVSSLVDDIIMPPIRVLGGSSQGGGHSNAELRIVSEQRADIPDRGLLRVPVCPANQSAGAAGAKGARLPELLFVDLDEGPAMPELHVPDRARRVVTGGPSLSARFVQPALSPIVLRSQGTRES